MTGDLKKSGPTLFIRHVADLQRIRDFVMHGQSNGMVRKDYADRNTEGGIITVFGLRYWSDARTFVPTGMIKPIPRLVGDVEKLIEKFLGDKPL